MASSHCSSSPSSSSSSSSLSSLPSPTRSGPRGKPHGRACLCAPTAHPGSFRCALHRAGASAPPGVAGRADTRKARSMRAVLLQTVGPSRRDLRRRGRFQPKPTRFALATRGDGSGVAVT